MDVCIKKGNDTKGRSILILEGEEKNLEIGNTVALK